MWSAAFQNCSGRYVIYDHWLQLKFVFVFLALKCLKIQTFRDYCPFISGRCRYTERASFYSNVAIFEAHALSNLLYIFFRAKVSCNKSDITQCDIISFVLYKLPQILILSKNYKRMQQLVCRKTWLSCHPWPFSTPCWLNIFETNKWFLFLKDFEMLLLLLFFFLWKPRPFRRIIFWA